MSGRLFVDHQHIYEAAANRSEKGQRKVISDAVAKSKKGKLSFGVVDTEERLKRYRRYVYEAGAIRRSEQMQAPKENAPLSQVNSTGQGQVIGDNIPEKELGRSISLEGLLS